MTTLRDIREGLGRAWDSLAEGWRQLSERAGHALTRFHPTRRGSELETADEQLMHSAPRWGLLAAEVEERADEVEVRMEAPGLEPEQFEVQVVDDILVIRGEKRMQREHRDGRFHVMECAYGSFERAITLPAPVDESGARARYRNGVLQVTLPKTSTARARRIEVAQT